MLISNTGHQCRGIARNGLRGGGFEGVEASHILTRTSFCYIFGKNYRKIWANAPVVGNLNTRTIFFRTFLYIRDDEGKRAEYWIGLFQEVIVIFWYCGIVWIVKLTMFTNRICRPLQVLEASHVPAPLKAHIWIFASEFDHMVDTESLFFWGCPVGVLNKTWVLTLTFWSRQKNSLAKVHQ